MPSLFAGAGWRRLWPRRHADIKGFALRRGPGTEMEFPRRLSSDWRDRGSSFFFQRHLPVVTEQVAPELELFDRWRKRDVDWHDLDSAHTILNIRARVKNRSRTRNSHNNVFAVAEINFALQQKIDIFGRGIQELERAVVAAKSHSSTRADQIERRILQDSVEQLHFASDARMLEVLTERDRSAQDSFIENCRMQKLRSAGEDDRGKMNGRLQRRRQECFPVLADF